LIGRLGRHLTDDRRHAGNLNDRRDGDSGRVARQINGVERDVLDGGASLPDRVGRAVAGDSANMKEPRVVLLHRRG